MTTLLTRFFINYWQLFKLQEWNASTDWVFSRPAVRRNLKKSLQVPNNFFLYFENLGLKAEKSPGLMCSSEEPPLPIGFHELP